MTIAELRKVIEGVDGELPVFLFCCILSLTCILIIILTTFWVV